ncbi:reticulon-4-interacting protein 1, mitochondrial-like [Ctenocephalides felis]|uniref:reticulon-4-interacting protein 1, mitochondrial-like n=1 Tax=Ctenocephalides felis TaxID=7515 RepID=UPI000E6E4C43|nr:reticulon-4-interacting protein 1, mitochondrial-like [Ctenocephalides felis]
MIFSIMMRTNALNKLLKTFPSCAKRPLCTNAVNVNDIEINYTRKRKMKAWHIHSYGSLDEVKLSEKYRTPFISHSKDVLVKVHAASVNPIDVAMLGGYGSTLLNVMRCSEIEFPLCLGRDFCGTIVDVGQEVNRKICPGQNVWGVVPVQLQGCHAEYVLVPDNCIALKPDFLSDVEAASIPYAGLTAWNALFSICSTLTPGHGPRGKKVLVLGAAGGVGSLAVQMLAAEKVNVIAVCSSDAMEYVSKLGVSDVLDYTATDFSQSIFDKGPFDIIFDCAGLGPQGAGKYPWKYLSYITLSSPMLRNTDELGMLAGMVKNISNLLEPNIKSYSSGQGVIHWAFFRPSLEGLIYLRELVCSEKLKPYVNEVFPFDNIPEAYKKVLGGHMRGKVIVEMP